MNPALSRWENEGGAVASEGQRGWLKAPAEETLAPDSQTHFGRLARADRTDRDVSKH